MAESIVLSSLPLPPPLPEPLRVGVRWARRGPFCWDLVLQATPRPLLTGSSSARTLFGLWPWLLPCCHLLAGWRVDVEARLAGRRRIGSQPLSLTEVQEVLCNLGGGGEGVYILCLRCDRDRRSPLPPPASVPLGSPSPSGTGRASHQREQRGASPQLALGPQASLGFSPRRPLPVAPADTALVEEAAQEGRAACPGHTASAGLRGPAMQPGGGVLFHSTVPPTPPPSDLVTVLRATWIALLSLGP